MKVAIAGATGLTGHHCLSLLLADTHVDQVIAIGRRPVGISHTKLREVFLNDGKLEQEVSVDAFISCLGTTIKKAGSKEAFEEVDLHLPQRLASALRANGCNYAAVVSAMGANENSLVFYNRVKGKMERAMRDCNFESLTILRPSLILGEREEVRTAERIATVLMKAVNPVIRGPLKNVRAIEAKDIARGLIAAVLVPQPVVRVVLSGDIKTLAGQSK